MTQSQDCGGLLAEMSAACFELGSLYTRERLRRERRFQNGEKVRVSPRMVWTAQDVRSAGIGEGCIAAMHER